MRRPQGYATTTEPGKADVEEDTFTCCHCNMIVFVAARADPSEFGGFCRMCMSHICPGCATEGTCKPFEKKLEEMEARDKLLRAATGG